MNGWMDYYMHTHMQIEHTHTHTHERKRDEMQGIVTSGWGEVEVRRVKGRVGG